MALPFKTSAIAARPFGQYTITYPIPQDVAHQFVHVQFTGSIANYASIALDTTFASATGGEYGTTAYDAYFCVQNGPMTWTDGIICKWSVIFANVPTSPRLEAQGVNYTYPGFSDASGNPVRNPWPRSVASQVQYLYAQSTDPVNAFNLSVALGSSVVAGQWYQITKLISGDSFASIGCKSVVGASTRDTTQLGVSFLCTVSTYSVSWNNGSILSPIVGPFAPFIGNNSSSINPTNITNYLSPNDYATAPSTVPPIGNGSEPTCYTNWILNKNPIPLEGSVLERYIGNIWVVRTRYGPAI